MSITGTQASAALPTSNTTAARAAATPALGGDHGAAHAPSGGARPMPPYGPLYNPFDQIRNLLDQLMRAIQQLNSPIGQYPPIEPPYGPYPPFEPPHVGCPHMPPIDPIDPWMPPPPPVTKKAPEVGDVLGTTVAAKGGPSADISVKSVHGTYASRDKAVAAAKHLAGIFGDKPFGVAVSGVPGQEKYTVVGLASAAPLKASQIGNIVGQVDDGWALDTIAFSAKTAKRVPLGPPVGPRKGDPTQPPITPPAPPVPVPAPAPAPHTH